MAKIHTHYDNLKVARLAPQEVIRAAYKALSQKYHPDKNPGDEKAARIMAILNSAYGTLSDPQRRKEHDEWIAAEEWEIEWLESTRNEDGQRGDKQRHDGAERGGERNERGSERGAERPWSSEQAQEPRGPRRPPARNWRWWGALAACLVLGWSAGVTMVAEPQLLSSMLASAWGGKGMNANAAQPPARGDIRAEARAELREAWATARPSYAEAHGGKPAPVKVLILSHVILPGAGAECDVETQTLVAPNGEPWPASSGYMEGFPVGNRGDDMQLMLDNAGNASAVFIKVYDTERRANVRYAYVQAHDKLVVDKLVSGKYEIRYQNLDAGANRAGCGGASRTAAASVDTAAAPLNN